MPDYPGHLIQTVAEVRLRQYGTEYDSSHLTWRDFADGAREILEALEPVTEYGQQYSSGGYLTMVDSPEIERIYPLADRVRDGQRNGGHVGRRRIVVVEDWEQVTEAPEGERP